MNIIHQDQYVTIYFQEDESLMTEEWTEETQNLKEAKFKELMFLWLELVKKYKVEYVLTNAKKSMFPITPTLQEWMLVNISSALTEFSFKKQAFIMPDEFFANLSIEQFVDDNQNELEKDKLPQIIAHFLSKEEAMKWLFA